jgi:hypothetical protein
MLFNYLGFSQDGLYYFNQNGKKDTIVSIYNSSTSERIPIGDTLVTRIKKGIIGSDQEFLLNLKNGAKIEGKIFIDESRKYIIYDLYVDTIRYRDGSFYTAKRFFKRED